MGNLRAVIYVGRDNSAAAIAVAAVAFVAFACYRRGYAEGLMIRRRESQSDGGYADGFADAWYLDSGSELTGDS